MLRATMMSLGVSLGTLFSAGASAQLTNLQTLELAKPTAVALSPDGAMVAYVSTQAVLEDDAYRATLFVVPARGGASKALVTEREIFSPQWSADGKTLFYLVRDGETYRAWRVLLDSGARQQVIENTEGVGAGVLGDYMEYVKPFRLSPDGKRAVYYTRNKAAGERDWKQKFSTNVLYTDDMSPRELFDAGRFWFRSNAAAPELWLVDFTSGQERLIWRAPEAAPGSAGFQFNWSPDGAHLAVFSMDNTSDKWIMRTRVELISVDTLQARRVKPKLGDVINPGWTADGRSLTFRSEGEVFDRTQERYQLRWYRYSLDDDTLIQVEGADDAASLLVEDIQKATGDPVHDSFRTRCSSNAGGRRAACVREGSMMPPQVVLYGRKSSGLFGVGRALTHLNPELERIELGQVSERKWQNDDGNEAKFGLILPTDYRKDRRYPLVVMLYNQYKPGEFSATPGFNSYAPQVYAGKGYAVLMQNLPLKRSDYTPGDFETALERDPRAVARSLRSQLDDLTARGIADPERLGVMGWSFGQFNSTYLLTQHPEWFRAAAAGDGCNHQPAFYWANPRGGRVQEENFFGGGPNGKYADRWRQVSPILNIDKLRAPLLLEYSNLSLCGVELHQTIRELGGASELIVYPHEEHVFESPANRYLSMERHFDWFNFWLLGEEDPQPKKAEQYQRWRAMRVKQCELFKGDDAPWYCRE